MKRFKAVATVALAIIAFSGMAAAQDAPQQNWIFKAPVFVFQPGLVTSNFIDTPEGAESETDFLFRVVTAIPTTIPRTTLVAILQFTPFNKVDAGGGNEFTANAPAFVYGPVFNIFSTPLIGFDFDVLGAYTPAARSEDESSYTHKLVLEGDLFIKIGGMMMNDQASRWRNLNIYTFLAYVATGLPNPEGSDNDPSRWVLLTGLSLPLAP
ncbi:MAG: hypothetical protein ACR2G6_07840 [Gemmatimonadaceae bacterium]